MSVTTHALHTMMINNNSRHKNIGNYKFLSISGVFFLPLIVMLSQVKLHWSQDAIEVGINMWA